MRQIKFRGKCQRGYDYSDGDGWIYGSLLQKDKVYAIVKTEDIDLSPNTDDGYSFVEDFGCIPVLPDTVSQFTGLTDRNGKEVYEGDIVKWNDSSDNECWRFAIVEINPDIQFECSNIPEVDGIQNSSSYCFKYASFFYRDTAKFLEVIGNIHDNPELLNEKQ